VADVVVAGRRLPLPKAAVVRAVAEVLRGERADAAISVTFLGRDAMRRMNAAWKGHDRPTDVIAFALESPGGGLVGDVYVCPWVAEREARARGVPAREELLRLVVHGVLHVIGHDHPDGDDRVGSPMWLRQERYVERLA
jgi:probable rRNA maturation factor